MTTEAVATDAEKLAERLQNYAEIYAADGSDNYSQHLSADLLEAAKLLRRPAPRPADGRVRDATPQNIGTPINDHSDGNFYGEAAHDWKLSEEAKAALAEIDRAIAMAPHNIAALTAPVPSAAEEPVAWQWYCERLHSWFGTNESGLEEYSKAGYQVRALYASPNASAERAKVVEVAVESDEHAPKWQLNVGPEATIKAIDFCCWFSGYIGHGPAIRISSDQIDYLRSKVHPLMVELGVVIPNTSSSDAGTKP